jgi:hypothetical protein
MSTAVSREFSGQIVGELIRKFLMAISVTKSVSTGSRRTPTSVTSPPTPSAISWAAAKVANDLRYEWEQITGLHDGVASSVVNVPTLEGATEVSDWVDVGRSDEFRTFDGPQWKLPRLRLASATAKRRSKASPLSQAPSSARGPSKVGVSASAACTGTTSSTAPRPVMSPRNYSLPPTKWTDLKGSKRNRRPSDISFPSGATSSRRWRAEFVIDAVLWRRVTGIIIS